MIYLIVDKNDPELSMLVQAQDEKELSERISLKPSEIIAGKFTSAEFRALDSSKFCVIST